jgi:predicted membrane channel-forming protein YqfA (hemolysin III family)
MQDSATIETSGMSSRWRTVCVIIIASLEVLFVWFVVRFVPTWDWWRLVMVMFLAAALAATGYDIAKKGKPTRLAFCFWLCVVLSGTVRDVYRVWNHNPNVDPIFALFGDALYIVLCIAWIWKNPLGPKKVDTLTIKQDFT